MYDKPICTGLAITNTPFTQAQPMAKPQGSSKFSNAGMGKYVGKYTSEGLCAIVGCALKATKHPPEQS